MWWFPLSGRYRWMFTVPTKGEGELEGEERRVERLIIIVESRGYYFQLNKSPNWGTCPIFRSVKFNWVEPTTILVGIFIIINPLGRC
jgi:hypothetical protein